MFQLQRQSRTNAASGDASSGYGVPVPLKDTLIGFSSGSLDGMIRVAVLAPVDVALNLAFTVHDALGASVFFEHLSAPVSN